MINDKKSIYIHVPWCRRRCPYCNFYFTVGKPNENFANAIINEYKIQRPHWPHGTFDTLYFGGGTPSLLSPKAIENIISYFFDEKAITKETEITLEANPEDILSIDLKEIYNAGVNRISLGVQSLDDKVLKFLGRKHKEKEAKRAISILGKYFSNISCDLIIGVLCENKKKLLDSIDFFSDSGITHISTYLLTIEENTNFYKRIKEKKMSVLNDDAQAKIYTDVQEKITSLNFFQYDISSYAKKGFESRHNLTYWANGEYIGLGPGAHSMHLKPSGEIKRIQNKSPINYWLHKKGVENNYSKECLSKTDALYEALAFGLRNMKDGIKPKTLEKRHKEAIGQDFFKVIEKLSNIGWIEAKDERIRIKKEGALFADAIMRDILCSKS